MSITEYVGGFVLNEFVPYSGNKGTVEMSFTIHKMLHSQFQSVCVMLGEKFGRKSKCKSYSDFHRE